MKTRRSLGWSFRQQAVIQLLQIVNLVVIARLLAPGEVGVFVLAVSAAALLGVLREAGLGSYLIREGALSDATVRAAFGLSILLSAALGLALLALRHPLEALVGAEGVAATLFPVGLAYLLFPLDQVPLALLRREMRFDLVHHAAVAGKLAGVGVSIGLAAAGWSHMALAWGLLAEAAARAALLSAFEPRALRLGPALSGWRRLAGFGLWTTGAALAGQGALSGTQILAGTLIGVPAAGLFERAQRLPAVVRRGLFVPLGRVILPAFSADLREGRAIGAKVERLVACQSAIVWPAFLLIGLLAPEVVALLLGPAWAEAAAILPWLLASAAIMVVLPQPEHLLVPHGAVRRLFALRLAQCANALAIGALAAPWGLEAFAAGRVLAVLIFLGLSWLALARFLGTTAGRLGRLHLASGAAALAGAAPLALALALGARGMPWGPAALAAAAFLAPLPWLAALRLSGHPLAAEISRLAARLARPRAAASGGS